MIASKFGIGQQVRHTLLGYLGVVVDIDPEYSLDEPSADELAVNAELRAAPWYPGSARTCFRRLKPDISLSPPTPTTTTAQEDK